MLAAMRATIAFVASLLLSAASVQAHAGTVALRDGAVVVEGRIDRDLVQRALPLLKEPAVTRLVITSGGGLVDAALDLAEAVHGRRLDVEVPSNCLSSCANYVVPAGWHKLLARPGVVGWHGTMAHVLHLQATGQEHWTEAEIADARRLARREQDFYRGIGVDGFVGWFAKLPPYGVDEFYTLAPADMARFGIRDVTVRDPEAPIANPLVVPVTVDWAGLEALRPAVQPD